MTDNIILHTSPKNVTLLCMQNRHWKLSIHKIFLLFNVDLPSQVMDLLIILTFIGNIHPMPIPSLIHSDVLLIIQVRIFLFWHVSLWKIRWRLLNMPQTINIDKYIPLPNMQGSPISGSPSIINNSPCYFSDEFYSGSSIPTSYFELKITSELELVYFFLPYPNWTKNHLFATISWTRPTTSLLILLVLPSLLFYSISPTFFFTTYPISIFVLICFFSFIPFLIVMIGELMVYFG